jgi:hypothetical protein
LIAAVKMDVVGGSSGHDKSLVDSFLPSDKLCSETEKKFRKTECRCWDLSNRKSGLTEELRDNVGKMASKHVTVGFIRWRRLKMRSVRLKTSTNKVQNDSLVYVLKV